MGSLFSPLASPGIDLFMDQPFSHEKLDWALQSLNVKSSPGIDRVDYHIIKKLPPIGKSALLKIYNQLYENYLFPNEWKDYIVFFIPKQGKNSFRPISLSSCLGKTMERMINNRLYWWLEFNNLIPISQFGFRKQKSCADNLFILHTNLLLGGKKRYSNAFLDVKSAYDHVLPDLLIAKLRDLSISPQARTFIYNVASFRRVSCRVFDFDKKNRHSEAAS